MTDFEQKMSERFERRWDPEQMEQWRRHHQRNRIWTGVFLLLVGTAAMVRYTLPVPEWLFSWQMLLIALGLFITIRSRFRFGAGLVPIIIGGIFLLNEFFPNFIDRRMIWPLVLMLVGLFLIFKPRRRPFSEGASASQRPGAPIYLDDAAGVNEEELDCVSIFGGIKKNILSKNFRGGDVVNILGGSLINLSQADIQGTVVLDVVQVFGGTKIIVPPHWDVKPEIAAIFAGIEDKRHIPPAAASEPSKVLLLKGTTIFGGIEIKSF